MSSDAYYGALGIEALGVEMDIAARTEEPKGEPELATSARKRYESTSAAAIVARKTDAKEHHLNSDFKAALFVPKCVGLGV